jgi:protein phosphatase
MSTLPDAPSPTPTAAPASPLGSAPAAATRHNRFFGPAQAPVEVQFAARTHQGKVRRNNEDHFLVERHRRRFDLLLHNLPAEFATEHHNEDAYVLAVADGMGGVAFGELASALALRTGMELVLSAVKWSVKLSSNELRELERKIDAYFELIDQTLIDKAWSEPRLSGMGTTLTIAYSVGPDVFIGHAGDSRAYLIRAGVPKRLTRDHTLAQELADRGAISQEDVATHRLRNTLTNYLGGPREGVSPDVIHQPLEHGDVLLLCSDGLTDMIDDEAIGATVSGAADLEDAAETLLQRALDAGGRDNVTVVLGRYGVPSAAPTGEFAVVTDASPGAGG